MTKAIFIQFTRHDRKIFWIIASLGLAAIAAHVYFISISVFAVVGRKEAEIASGRAGARVAELESTYARLYAGIDQELAHREGFLPVAAPRYITTETDESGFSLSNERAQR